jgi:tagaturonate epimerase
MTMKLAKYSIGMGDRFAHQGEAQLQAVLLARQMGVDVTPVWNKSYREHHIIGSQPAGTREAADRAVNALKWDGAYFCDADHIGLKTVDFFLEACDFFTIDVADFIGESAPPERVKRFVDGISSATLIKLEAETGVSLSAAQIEEIAGKYLLAVTEAGEIYRHIRDGKSGRNFVVEVSMDETRSAQTPVELFFILCALAQQGIPVATIAPKFTGRFNKGVEYFGDVEQFTREFEQDVAILRLVKQLFPLPAELKLSIHSGSDKFSLYPRIHQILSKYDAGVHLKTAGTTWLEELAGLAEAGGDGLALAKEIYVRALTRFEELSKPYATVIDIDSRRLPAAEEVSGWDEGKFVNSLRHDSRHPDYNPHLRQLLHISFKIAAEMGEVYTKLLEEHRGVIAKNVTENLFERHIKPVFIGHQSQ